MYDAYQNDFGKKRDTHKISAGRIFEALKNQRIKQSNPQINELT